MYPVRNQSRISPVTNPRASAGTKRTRRHPCYRELVRLRNEESQLASVAGGGITRADGLVRTQRRSAKTGGRIDWRAALERLPKEFKARDVRKLPGLVGKRPSEIFAGITRWIDAKLVKRK